MKFVMNGCLIIGTMDGANVEIAQEIGEENMFIFGERVDGVNRIRKQLYEGKRGYLGGRLKRVWETIKSGFFGDTSMRIGNTKWKREKTEKTSVSDFYFVSQSVRP